MCGKLHITLEQKTGNNIIQSFCSSVLFWDIPVTKLPPKPSSETIKEEETFYKEETFYTPSDVPQTSKHQDLCWKPLIKVLYTNTEQKEKLDTARIP